jgi:hypothetical protein
MSMLSDIMQPLDIFAPGVVDEGLDGHERAAGRQGVVGRTNRCIFFSRFQSCRIIPMVMRSALGRGR